MKKEKWTLANMPDLKDKVFIVTGANSGIGFEATKAFAMKNAKVIMGCRSLERGQAAKDKILESYKDADLDIILLDLMDFDSIKAFAAEIIKKYTKIDVLLNNAGIMTVPYGQTKNGLEQQIGVNHFGHYYLTMSLLKLINSTENSRIVNIASIAHRFGKLNPDTFLYEENKKYNKSLAYAQSKLANLLFTYGLKDRLEKENSEIKVLAAHPGVTKTNLGRHIKTRRLKTLSSFIARMNQETPQGALPGIRACTDYLAASGEYYGPHGFYNAKGYPVVEKSTKRSYSKELQNTLWEHSVKITNLDIKL